MIRSGPVPHPQTPKLVPAVCAVSTCKVCPGFAGYDDQRVLFAQRTSPTASSSFVMSLIMASRSRFVALMRKMSSGRLALPHLFPSTQKPQPFSAHRSSHRLTTQSRTIAKIMGLSGAPCGPLSRFSCSEVLFVSLARILLRDHAFAIRALGCARTPIPFIARKAASWETWSNAFRTSNCAGQFSVLT